MTESGSKFLGWFWTACNPRVATDMQVRVKASWGTENITIDKVELQLMFEYKERVGYEEM